MSNDEYSEFFKVIFQPIMEMRIDSEKPEEKLEFYSVRYVKPENKIKRFFKKSGKAISKTLKKLGKRSF